MSDEQDKLQRQLEHATADDCPADAAMDPQTASLRESWIALGQLLEAAQPDPGSPLQLRQAPRRTAGVWKKLAGATVLAASMTIGFVLARTLVLSIPPDAPLPPDGQIAMPEVKQDVPAQEAEQRAAHARQPAAVVAKDTLEWDDSLDRQIVLAGQEVVRIQQDWYRLDDAVGPVLRGLEQMEQDLEENVL